MPNEKPKAKKRSGAGGVGGFLAVLIAALLWKLGVIGGAGGPFPTPGGSDSRPATFGEAAAGSRPSAASRPESRTVEVGLPSVFDAASNREGLPPEAADQPPAADALAAGPAHVRGRLVYRDGAAATGLRYALSLFHSRSRGDADAATESFDGMTDAEGRFGAAAAAGRDVLIELRVGGATGDAAAPFVLRAAAFDSERPLDFGDVRLARETLLATGRVLLPDGGPASGAAVVLRGTGAESDVDALGVRADADGRFQFRGPEDRLRFELTAETEHMAALGDRVFDRGAADVVLRLRPAVEVRGTLVVPDPSLLSAAEVLLVTEHGARAAHRRPANDGSFRFTHAPVGRFKIVARLPGAATTRDFEVLPETALRFATVAPIPLAESFRARVATVLDSDGAPIAGARLWIALETEPDARWKTDSGADGVARIFAPQGASLLIAASAAGFAPIHARSADDSDLRVVLVR